MKFSRWQAIACGVLIVIGAPASAMFDEIAKRYNLAAPDTPERAALRAEAPEIWIDVAVDNLGNKHLTNPSRFKTHYSRGVFVAWIRTVAKHPTPVYDDRPKPVYSTAMHRFEFNCETEQSRLLNVAYYDIKGASVKAMEIDGAWTVVTPETSGEKFLRASCALAVKHGFL